MADRAASAVDTPLDTGRFATIDEVAAAEKINSSRMSRLLRLTLLAPEIVASWMGGSRTE